MNLNTLKNFYVYMEYKTPEFLMNEDLRLASLKPIERMLEISKAAGLIG